jgi:uncharacterized protein YlaI
MAKALQLAVSNFREHMRNREYPVCFTLDEFQAWKIHEAELNTQPTRMFVCRDCTSEYQKKMSAEGRCFNASIPLAKIVDKT